MSPKWPIFSAGH